MDPASLATAGCVFAAGQRRWRVAAADVLDVVPWPRLTPVPLQTRSDGPELLGVFAWQDAVAPVYDLAGLPPNQRRRVVIVRATVRGAEIPLGIAAGEVLAGDDVAPADVLSIADLTAKLLRSAR